MEGRGVPAKPITTENGTSQRADERGQAVETDGRWLNEGGKNCKRGSGAEQYTGEAAPPYQGQRLIFE